MVKTELRSILKNPLMIVVLLAVALIPSIYAGLFLNSMWDPYGELDCLPVAVVNQDQPVSYKETELHVGKDLAEELTDNDAMDFHIVDAKSAKKGLKKGTYYMVITIPADFSKCASTVMDEHPQKMLLSYETNPGTNYIAMKMGQSAMKEIKASMMEEVTKTYTQTVFDSLITVADGFEDAAEGTQKMSDGEVSLVKGNTRITRNLKKLADSSLVFQEGADTLQEGVKTYTNGVDSLDKGLTSLNKGVKKLSTQATGGTKQLAKGSKDLKTGVKSYTKGVSLAKSGSLQLVNNNKALNGGMSSVSTGLTSLKSGSTAILSGVKQIQSSLNQALKKDNVAQIELAAKSLPQLEQGLTQLNTAVNDSGEEGDAGLDVSGITTSMTKVGKHLQNAGEALTLAGDKQKGPLARAIALQMKQLGADLTRLASNDTTAKAAVKQDLELLNDLCGTEQLKTLLAQYQLDNKMVLSFVNELDQETGVTGYLSKAGNEMQSAKSILLAVSKNDMESQVTTLKESVSQLALASQQLCQPSADALTTMLGGMQQIQTSFNQTQKNDGSSGLVEGMTALDTGIASLQSGIDGKKGLKAGLKNYTNGVNTLDKGLTTLQGNNNRLNKGASSLATGCDTLDTGLNTGVKSLRLGAKKLSNGSKKLVSNSQKLVGGSKKLSQGSKKISEGSQKLRDGSIALGDGLTELSEGTNELHDALRDGETQVRENEANEENIDMMVAPLETKETQITTVKNNGHAMAAYMLTVGLWVGCLAFCLMYPLASYQGEFVSGRRWWLSKAVVLYPLSILQGLIVLFVLHVALGFEPQNWPRTILVTVLVSQTFMAIMYFFNVLMGKVGSFLMLIFMVLQLAGSAGTYPVELSGSMVAKIHKYVPFTYAVDSFRSAIANGESVGPDIWVLLVLVVVFTIMTMLVFAYRGYRIKAGKPTIYDWIEEKGLA